MAISKKFVEFKGISSRTSDLLRDENYFSDALNVVISKRQSIKKRRGTTNVATTNGGNGLVNYNGDTGLIGLDTTVRDVASGSWVAKTNSGNNTLDTTNLASFAQDNARLFIANGKNELMKYDGASWYRAGCPNSNYGLFKSGTSNVTTGTETVYEVITQFVSHDLQGNTIEGRIAPLLDSAFARNTFSQWSDATSVTLRTVVPTQFYSQLSAGTNKWAQNTVYTAAAGTVVMAPDNKIYQVLANHTSSNTGTAAADFIIDYNLGYWMPLFEDPCGFNHRFAKVNGAQSNVNTVTVDSGHNVVAGDYIFVREGSVFRTQRAGALLNGWELPVFENWRLVTAVTATTITFDGFKTDFEDNEIISASLIVRFYRRVNGTESDFSLFLEWGVEPNVVEQPIVVPVAQFLSQAGSAVNPAQTRGTPPKGRYLTIFQNLLVVCGNEDEPFNVYWSNTENLETFDPSNSQIIGDSRDGVITGLAVNNDYLIVFKEKAIYFMSGAISDANFRVERVPCGDIGCQSHFSIKDVHGVIHFLDTSGVYRIRGGGMPEDASFHIAERFTEDTTGLDFTKAVALVDDKRHHYKLCIPAYTGAVTNANTRLFVLDFEYDAWWIHSNIDYSGGADVFSDVIYFTMDDASVTTRKEQSTFADQGSAITAYVKTHWFNMGEPSIPKKFIDYKIYALESSNYTLRVRSEKDWVAATYPTDFNLAFTSSIRFAKNNAVSSHERALRLYLSNETINEDLEITGIEIEWEAPYRDLMKR